MIPLSQHSMIQAIITPVEIASSPYALPCVEDYDEVRAHIGFQDYFVTEASMELSLIRKL